MENLSPTLCIIFEVKRALESGQSTQKGVENYIKKNSIHGHSKLINSWLLFQNNPNNSFNHSKISLTQRYLLEILSQGLKGHPILSLLKAYEAEVILKCEEEIELYLSSLPLKMLFPLMFLIFPSMMLVLVFPLMRTFELF